MSDLSYAASYPDRCHEEVQYRGSLGSCDRPAVAARRDERSEGGTPYPVCHEHARPPMVGLRDLLTWHGDVAVRTHRTV